MKTISKIALAIIPALLLSACNDSSVRGKTLADFQKDQQQLEQKAQKDPEGAVKDLVSHYNIDQLYVISTQIRKDAFDPEVKVKDPHKITLGEVFDRFDKAHPNSPVLNGKLAFKDAYVRDVDLFRATKTITQDDPEYAKYRECAKQYRDGFTQGPEFRAQVDEMQQMKISDILKACK